MQNCLIEQVQNFNFLGITINQHLTWNDHIGVISNKILRSITTLNRLKHYLPVYTLKVLYNSLILSQLTYGILAWGNTNTRLYKLQKKSLRIIANVGYNAHTGPIFKSLFLLKLEDIYRLNVLKFYYRHCHNQLPPYFQRFIFKTRGDVHHHDTRQKNLINITKVRTVVAENTLRHISCKIINESLQCILEKIYKHSLQGFNSYVKLQYINSYSTECTVTDCYICNKR